jgi:hypothetical protein
MPELQQHAAVGFADDFFIIHKKDSPSSTGVKAIRMLFCKCHGQLSGVSCDRKCNSDGMGGHASHPSYRSMDQEYEYEESMIFFGGISRSDYAA